MAAARDGGDHRMNILFAVSHAGFLRNFESTLALLAERGHRLHIVTDRRQVADVLDGKPIIDRLTTRFPDAFTFEAVQFSKKQSWYAYAILVRAALDYWRYLAPTYDDAPKLRARGRDNAPAPVVWLAALPGLRSRPGIGLLTRVFRRLERIVPVRPEVESLFDRYPPDVLFITPLLYFGSQQVDYVRCARRRGINSVLGVGSWDHLTTKGAIHEMPDRMLVWNDLQRREAVDLHGAQADQVVVTGAQAYDHWFASSPSTSREEFCERVGVPAAHPYLLYLCSSPFIAPYEVGFVRRWIEAIRSSSDETLRSAGIVVRPHPQNAAQWTDVDLSASPNVSIWPRAGANPIGLDARRAYYDSMYHSHAVVGVNTSALIESGIVGRLVYSIKVPEFSGTQEGTLHFQHLKRGGLLTLADTLDEHVTQLAASFASTEQDRAQVRGFIQNFVRPHGLDVAATPRVVTAVEALAAEAPAPRELPRRLRPLQLAVQVTLTLIALPLRTARRVHQGWEGGAGVRKRLGRLRKRVRSLAKGVARLGHGLNSRLRVNRLWRIRRRGSIFGVWKRLGPQRKRLSSAWRRRGRVPRALAHRLHLHRIWRLGQHSWIAGERRTRAALAWKHRPRLPHAVTETLRVNPLWRVRRHGSIRGVHKRLWRALRGSSVVKRASRVRKQARSAGKYAARQHRAGQKWLMQRCRRAYERMEAVARRLRSPNGTA